MARIRLNLWRKMIEQIQSENRAALDAMRPIDVPMNSKLTLNFHHKEKERAI